MDTYIHHRFPPDIISYEVWLHYRFNLSHRDIEDILAERGITVSHESIRLWCNKFGTKCANRWERRHHGYGDTFYIDEVFAGVPDHADQWQAKLSVNAHAEVYNPFNLGRHLVSANQYRNLRIGAFKEWSLAVA